MAKHITSDEIDRLFDEGKDVIQYGDPETFERPNKRINIDLPEPFLRRLDAYAAECGVTRQALVKVWLKERIDEEDRKAMQLEKLRG